MREPIKSRGSTSQISWGFLTRRKTMTLWRAETIKTALIGPRTWRSLVLDHFLNPVLSSHINRICPQSSFKEKMRYKPFQGAGTPHKPLESQDDLLIGYVFDSNLPREH